MSGVRSVLRWRPDMRGLVPLLVLLSLAAAARLFIPLAEPPAVHGAPTATPACSMVTP